MKTKLLIIAAGLIVGLSGAAFTQTYPNNQQNNGYEAQTGRSAYPMNSQNNGDPSAPATGGGYETRESSTYGGTQIPSHGGK